ncbi:MAG: glycosyltransferase [Bacteroidia bacterium]|nr:glycosyltransferase [Bacteroidia bacterium]
MIDFGRWQKHALQRRQITPPSPSEMWGMRFLILLGIGSVILFLGWFIDSEHIGTGLLFWPLTFALGFKMIELLHEWYHYAAISVPKMPESTRTWTVDMLTTYCAGEPYPMIINTLRAMKEVTYPHKTYLCDEANDPYLKKVCEELGVIHVYRGTNKTNAKAGNINYALYNVADGELAVILDPDHEPAPDFLDRVVNYFENPEIGYVQCVQAYSNRTESFIAKGAAEQTYHFYGPMMMSMNSYGTAQAIGANCTFRRAALDSIGGHAPGLCEDMHTAMQIHAKGWKSLYVPELLTRGLVPATLSAYYKQQMKWSRGAFELLFLEYPRLIRKLTWRQNIHYFTIPLYFLSGLISLIDILIPILSLVLAQVPWHVEMDQFLMVVTPMLALSMLIRQFAQKYMLEEHERGFHVLGGFLRFGTWWVFLVGFVYSIFRIKVPYIPTPKDDKPSNAWILSLPNIIAIIASIAAAIYGLSIDWNPYSFFMAGYALVNATILTLVVLMSQQKMMISIYDWLGMDELITGIRAFWWNLRHYILYRLIRNSSLVLSVVMIFTLSSYAIYETKQRQLMKELALRETNQINFFYTGIQLEGENPEIAGKKLKDFQEETGINPGVAALNYSGFNITVTDTFFRNISDLGVVPLINWLPVLKDPDPTDTTSIFAQILQHKYDREIRALGIALRKIDRPVFLNFAPGSDDPQSPWYQPTATYPQEFREAWKYMVAEFVNVGASNATWVYSPASPEAIPVFFPGENYVNWIGVSLHDEPGSFSQRYEKYAQTLRNFEGWRGQPVIIQNFAEGLSGEKTDLWLEEALRDIEELFPEIHGLVSGEMPDNLKKTFDQFASSRTFNQAAPFTSAEDLYPHETEEAWHSPFVKKTETGFELIVDQKPFYIQGVAYNATHDWRDGYLPLTRRQLTKDFSRIQQMGANTIRRYGNSGIYEKNVLNIAEEHELKVLYGLWFDPAVDYYTDSAEVEKIRRKSLETVRKFKDYPAVLGWTLGNETWASLKYHYAPPYLSRVRRAHIHLVEEIAREIKKIDPNRPVFVALEHNQDLAACLDAYRRFAPSVDIIGINTYYGERIETLEGIANTFIPDRPYLVSSFGPLKYWDPSTPNYSRNLIPEENTSFEKAQQYGRSWSEHVEKHKGSNVGGIAFCWSDRMEGTATWFGVTDFKGRLKPSYYALKNVWKKEKNAPPLYEAYINGPGFALERGKTYTFRAVTENNRSWNMTYEWFLMREKYLDDSGDVKLAFNGKEASIYIPEDNYSYRLYLYISDYYGNVVTASKPIDIQEKEPVASTPKPLSGL